MNKRYLQFGMVVIILCTGLSHLQANNKPPFFSREAEQWADSILNKLNREERIAQLIMVAAWSNKDAYHVIPHQTKSMVSEV